MAANKTIAQQLGDVQKDALALIDRLDKKVCHYPLLDQVGPLSGNKVRPAHVVLGLGALAVLIALLGFGARAVINLVGFIYPLWASMKALKSEEKDDDTMWLTYWVIYAFFTVLESVADFALGWLPLYFFLKLGFLVFCFLPQTKGAQLVYKTVLEPFFNKYESQVEAAAAKITKKSE